MSREEKKKPVFSRFQCAVIAYRCSRNVQKVSAGDRALTILRFLTPMERAHRLNSPYLVAGLCWIPSAMRSGHWEQVWSPSSTMCRFRRCPLFAPQFECVEQCLRRNRLGRALELRPFGRLFQTCITVAIPRRRSLTNCVQYLRNGQSSSLETRILDGFVAQLPSRSGINVAMLESIALRDSTRSCSYTSEAIRLWAFR